MTRWTKPLLSLILAFVCLTTSQSAIAEEVVAVLSSDSGPYLEALAGVRETIGQPVSVVHLAKGEKTPRANVVIAIGGKAAVSTYPADATLIYCVAPALWSGLTSTRAPRQSLCLTGPQLPYPETQGTPAYTETPGCSLDL